MLEIDQEINAAHEVLDSYGLKQKDGMCRLYLRDRLHLLKLKQELEMAALKKSSDRIADQRDRFQKVIRRIDAILTGAMTLLENVQDQPGMKPPIKELLKLYRARFNTMTAEEEDKEVTKAVTQTMGEQEQVKRATQHLDGLVGILDAALRAYCIANQLGPVGRKVLMTRLSDWFLNQSYPVLCDKVER